MTFLRPLRELRKEGSKLPPQNPEKQANPGVTAKISLSGAETTGAVSCRNT